MRKGTLIALASGMVLAMALPAGSALAQANNNPAPYGSWGCMGMGPGMMGPGMMGMGPWMMSPGMMWNQGPVTNPAWRSNVPALNLSTGDVKAYLERWITMTGDPRFKVGKVTEKDDKTIIAEIVTKDGALAQRYSVDRHTGAYYPVQ